MIKTRPLSIIIPHYQKQEALKRTWEELKLQIRSEDRVYIVDDHSPNGVPDFDCSCTKVIKPPKHTPHIYRLNTLRNLGVESAANDPCIIIDPDCIPNPRFLDNARNLCDASILFGGCIDKIQEDGSIKQDARRNSGKSYWCDRRDKGGAGIWGGCMLFSKSRTKLIGWFNEEYNGAWGAEEHDFASRCYHSGMRLRYSMELQVTHLWHPKATTGNKRNVALWKTRRDTYRDHLGTFTPYNPAVGVIVITMLRPTLIDQCLRSIFRNRVPLKVRLIVNGDDGEDTNRIAEEWGRRWAVDLVKHERKWPAVVRNEALQWAKEKKLKYLIFLDDDVAVKSNGLGNLVSVAEQHPEYVAISGVLRYHVPRKNHMLGGLMKEGIFQKYRVKEGTFDSDWVGGGFTIHRVKPPIFYDEDYETGYNDYDWSLTAREKGHRLGVTSAAEAYHGVIFTREGLTRYNNSIEYNRIRYDEERHKRMRQYFKEKWGYEPKEGGLCD